MTIFPNLIPRKSTYMLLLMSQTERVLYFLLDADLTVDELVDLSANGPEFKTRIISILFSR